LVSGSLTRWPNQRITRRTQLIPRSAITGLRRFSSLRSGGHCHRCELDDVHVLLKDGSHSSQVP
jgi:hypothetical protein